MEPPRSSSTNLNGRNTCYDFMRRENGNWDTGRISIDSLCDQDAPAAEVMVVFLPEMSKLVGSRDGDKLVDRFTIPKSFWSEEIGAASGYFGCRDTRNSGGVLQGFCAQLRLLTKQPVETKHVTYLVKDIKANYQWYHLGVYIAWTPFEQVVALCFDLPQPLKDSLSDLSELNLNDPFSFYAVFLQHALQVYDKALWSWRDRIRDLEKHRASPDNPEPDYIMMHELARHAIHSSETLAMAIETIISLIQEHEIFFVDNEPILDTSIRQFQQARRVFRSQLTLLKCFHLRSKTLEDRLQNEINLAFNTVAQYNSRISVQIGEATKVDSAAMRTISVLGLIFLPGTFICALFSTSFFNFSPGSETEPQRWAVSEKFWIYWVVAVPVTLLTVAYWAVWQRSPQRMLRTLRNDTNLDMGRKRTF